MRAFDTISDMQQERLSSLSKDSETLFPRNVIRGTFASNFLVVQNIVLLNATICTESHITNNCQVENRSGPLTPLTTTTVYNNLNPNGHTAKDLTHISTSSKSIVGKKLLRQQVQPIRNVTVFAQTQPQW
ncbi:hypothetical protein ACTXT7_003209 [Hymenolepis weldensis]